MVAHIGSSWFYSPFHKRPSFSVMCLSINSTNKVNTRSTANESAGTSSQLRHSYAYSVKREKNEREAGIPLQYSHSPQHTILTTPHSLLSIHVVITVVHVYQRASANKHNTLYRRIECMTRVVFLYLFLECVAALISLQFLSSVLILLPIFKKCHDSLLQYTYLKVF